MKLIEKKSFDEERAFYGSDGIRVVECKFDGERDGESAFKESRDVETENCYFNLRYPFWHDSKVIIRHCEMTELCRAALWYSNGIRIDNTKLHGIKALRECENIHIANSDIVSTEFGWFCKDVKLEQTAAVGEYFMMRSDRLDFKNASLKGKYSFQYITDSVFENCNFDTKDAFWHAKNVTVKNSVIKGEYLGWYCDNVTFENCIISGTQPLCYCKGLKLINCEMHGADLAFERSDVEAEVTTALISIKNAYTGYISAPAVDELIIDDEKAKCKLLIGGVEV
ncbi:MAG: DUF3737 family protein [Clostridia bacterium]|nr:DUF3737 family protein [Clostridia bacterium]